MRCRAPGFLYYWGPPIILEGIIFFLSSNPLPKSVPGIPFVDKIYHAIIYLILALLIWRALFYSSTDFFQKRALLFTLIITILLGISDEWHQSFVPARSPELLDLLFDAIGATICVIFLRYYNKVNDRDKVSGVS